MSRTQGRNDSDTGYADGQIFISAFDAAADPGTIAPGGATPGQRFVTITNPATITIPISSVLFRYGVQDWLQEQFGSARAGGAQGLPVGGFTTLTTAALVAGVNVSIPVINSAAFTAGRKITLDTGGPIEYPTIVSFPDATHILVNQVLNAHASGVVISENLFTTPAGVTGAPPFTAASQLTPVTSARPKGILFREIYPVYTPLTTAPTALTIGLFQTVFANATAPVTTPIIAPANNGMPLTVATNPYVTPIQVPVAAQTWRTTKFADYSIELISTGAAGTISFYGVFIDVAFNFS